MTTPQIKRLRGTILLFLSITAMSNSLLSPLQQQGHNIHKPLTPISSPSSSSNRSFDDEGSTNSRRSSNSNRRSSRIYNTMNSADVEDGSNNDEEGYFIISKHDTSSPRRVCRTMFHRAGQILTGNNKKEEKLMAMALFWTYFAVMGAKCALPSTFALITSDESGLLLQNINSNPQQIMAQVLTISTCGIAFGKFLLGPIIDKYGGALCLKVALSLLMSLLVIISSTTTFRTFAIAWIFVDFIFSSCWAACLNAIHHSFSQDQWASRIGQLAVAARVGNASSFFFFASLLQWSQERRIKSGGLVGQSWRSVFWASAAMQIIPIALLVMSSSKSSNKSDAPSHQGEQSLRSATASNEEEMTALSSETKSKTLPTAATPSIRKSLHVLKEEARQMPYWMHLISRSCLMIIASFLLFVPSYMTNAFGVSSANGARVGSLYALGCLLAVSLGSKHFSVLNTRSKVLASVGYLGLVLLVCISQLLHISGLLNMSAFGGGLAMFLWGVGFAVPFYIPPSLFALKRGGSESSATSKYA